MLTAKAVATLLGISPRKVYDLAQSGKLPSHRYDDAVRFAPADVQEYMSRCRFVGTPETSAGGTSSTVSLKALETDLAAYFRKAGVKPKLTPTIGKKAADSTRLQLVSSEPTRRSTRP